MRITGSQVSSLRFLAAASLVFLAFEFALRIKLGSIFVLAMFWTLGRQALALKLGRPGFLNALDRFLLAFMAAGVISIFIFVVFGAGNAVLRTIDPAWRFLQLP